MKKQLVIIFALLFIVVDISTIILTKGINNAVSNYDSNKEGYENSDVIVTGDNNVASSTTGDNDMDSSTTGVEDEEKDLPIEVDTTPSLIVTEDTVTCTKAKFGYSTQGLTVNQTYNDISENSDFPMTSTLISAPVSNYLMLVNYKCDAGEVETGIMPFVYDDLTISTSNKDGVVVLDDTVYSYVLDHLTENLGEDDVKDAKIGEVQIGDKNCIKITYTVGENSYHTYAISYLKNFFIVKGVSPLTSSADIETPMQEIIRTLSVAG